MTLSSDEPEFTENQDVPDDEDFDDDESQFTTYTVDDAAATDIYGNTETPPGNEEAAESPNQNDKHTQIPSVPPPEIALPAEAGGIDTQPILHPNNDQEPTLLSTSPMVQPFQRPDPFPKTRSLAHEKNSRQKG